MKKKINIPLDISSILIGIGVLCLAGCSVSFGHAFLAIVLLFAYVGSIASFIVTAIVVCDAVQAIPVLHFHIASCLKFDRLYRLSYYNCETELDEVSIINRSRIILTLTPIWPIIAGFMMSPLGGVLTIGFVLIGWGIVIRNVSPLYEHITKHEKHPSTDADSDEASSND